jgi:hypothetical protein
LSRYAVTALVLCLLGGTAVALGIIEGFKLEKNPISGPLIDKTFSPVCRCPQRVAHIQFRLRNTGTLTLAVVAADGKVVRTLADNKRFFHGMKRFDWDGRDDAGKIVPDGFYRLRLHFGGQHRTIVMPRGTIVDTKRPTVTLVSIKPRVFSPNGDRVHDLVSIRYRVNEPAKVNVLVDGKVAIRGYYSRTAGTLYWPGTVRGRTLPAGTYAIGLVAQDQAGNVSSVSRTPSVRIHYLSLPASSFTTKKGTVLTIPVLTDARAVHWRFQGRTGTSYRRRVVIRPTKAGTFPLVVAAGGHEDRATVLVRS